MINRSARHQPQADAGMTLVEVVVALLVFALIASGVVAGMTTLARMTADDRARVVAANLAAEQTDLARAIGDPFKVSDSTTLHPFRTADGQTQNFKIARTVSWVSSTGQDISCGSSTNLFFLRVHVVVSWDGELPTTVPVETDTLIAPAGRITDPTTGTIAVSVVGADGLPMPGIDVSIVPTSGGAALTTQPSPTGDDGCTYATKVAPGTYAVTLDRTGYVDINQVAEPVKSAVVTVGNTQSVSFQYDAGATYPVNYVSNDRGANALLPPGLNTTFVNPTIGFYVTGTPSASVLLHPFTAGYTALAGALGTTPGKTTCAAVDPAAWAAGRVGTTALAAGQRPPTEYGPPGGTATHALDVPMGVIAVKSTATGYLRAVESGPAPGIAGEPGCQSTATYVFGQVLKNGTVDIALPFGSWKLFSGTSDASQVTPVLASNLSSPTNAASEVAGDGTVTLDPRTAG